MSDGAAGNLRETPPPVQRVLDRYGFVDDPFGEAVDAKVFSGVGNRSRAASQIEQLFRSAAAECLLIAPSGGGKRTLARHVIEQLGAGWYVAWVDAREIRNPFDLILELIGQLGLLEDGEGTEVEGSSPIAELVARRAEGGENCLLVVLHADQLPPETQRWLRSQGRQGDRPEMGLRQLWLAESSQPIEEDEEEHQWTAITLDPLTNADALEYLQDRFAAAGRSERLSLEARDVARLNHVAGGVPGRLNRITWNYLVEREKNATERQPRAQRQSLVRWRPRARLLYALIGAAVLAAALVMTARYLSVPSDTDIADGLAPDEVEPTGDEIGADLVGDEPDAGSQQSIPDSGPASESTDEGDELALAPDQESIDADAPTVDAEPTPSDADTATVDGEPAPPDANAATVEPEPTPPDADAATGDTQPTPSGDDGAVIEDAGERTLYTVQIAGGRNRENVAALGSELGVRVDTNIARATLDGRPWYVLISGRHDSIGQARAAIADLPPEVRARSPWPRPLSDLEVLESTRPTGQPSLDVADQGAVTGEQGNDDAAAREAPFTLQVVGVRDRSSLEALVSELDNPERYEIVSTTFEGRPWYVLTHGRYETAEAARSAIELLPEELQQYAPWPRDLSELE